MVTLEALWTLTADNKIPISESLKWGNVGMNMGVMLVSQHNKRDKAKSV